MIVQRISLIATLIVAFGIGWAAWTRPIQPPRPLEYIASHDFFGCENFRESFYDPQRTKSRREVDRQELIVKCLAGFGPNDLIPLADAGDVDAQAALAFNYYQGSYQYSIDFCEAWNWGVKAAEAGHFFGALSVMLSLYDGIVVAEDKAEAFRWSVYTNLLYFGVEEAEQLTQDDGLPFTEWPFSDDQRRKFFEEVHSGAPLKSLNDDLPSCPFKSCADVPTHATLQSCNDEATMGKIEEFLGSKMAR